MTIPFGFQGAGKALAGAGEGVYTEYMTEPKSREQHSQNLKGEGYKTYLFYDLETSGSHKCFDQVLQFAAIRTDSELQELERHELQIKLNLDITPDPRATLVHQIPLQVMKNQGENEFHAMQQIHALLNTQGTQSGGYNTLGFDDEFLRFSFYRNLLAPYNHQWANGCGRFDLYPMTILYYLYQPQVLNWPMLEGLPSLKLEQLSAANQLAQGMAHHAMTDVEATLALARRLRTERRLWDYAWGYFDKDTDQQRQLQLKTVDGLPNLHRLGLMVGKASKRDLFQFPVLFIGKHRHYKNQNLWLRLDTEELNTACCENISTSTWVVHKKLGEPPFLLPFTRRFIQKLSQERLKLTQDNIEKLKQEPHLLNAICEYHQEYKYPFVPNADTEAALYQSNFWSAQEQQLCQRFHQKAAQKAQIAECFSGPLRTLAMRVIGRHFPGQLTDELAKEFESYLAATRSTQPSEILVDYRGQPRLTPDAAKIYIAEFLKQTDVTLTQRQLLYELGNYSAARCNEHILLTSR